MPEALKAHLQARLFVLVLLAFLPALAVFTYASRHVDALRERVVDEQMARTAEVARAEYVRLLADSEALLGALSHVPAIRDATSECTPLLRAALQETPQYTTLSRIGLDGYLSCGSLTLGDGLYLGDRTYFTLATTSSRFAVGDYALGRITGKPGVGVAYPIVDETGTNGVLAASIDLSRLAENALSVALAEGATLTVLNRKGQVLVRVPDLAQLIGDSLGATASEGFPTMPAERGLELVDGTDLDGFPRRFAVSALTGRDGSQGGYVVIGADRQALAAEVATFARSERWILAIGAVLLAVLAWIWGHYFLVRRAVEEKRAAMT